MSNPIQGDQGSSQWSVSGDVKTKTAAFNEIAKDSKDTQKRADTKAKIAAQQAINKEKEPDYTGY